MRKVLTYKFHYDYIKDNYGNNSRLLFTHTESIMDQIKTEDVYEDFRYDKEMFDLVIIRRTQNTIMIQSNYLLVKWSKDLLD